MPSRFTFPAVVLIAILVMVGALWYFEAERDAELRSAARRQCELVNARVNEIVITLHIVTAGGDAPQSDIGRRLFAAIDALQVQPVADCRVVIP